MAPRRKKGDPEPEPDDWEHSEGRKLLRRDIRDGQFNNVRWQEAFYFRPEFAVGATPDDALRLFKNRFASAKRWVEKKQNRAEEEEIAMLHDRAKYPPPATNHKGEPRWNGSAAEAALKEDYKQGKHALMSSDQYHNSRPEFAPFSKTTIKRHVRQERDTDKFLTQYRGMYYEQD